MEMDSRGNGAYCCWPNEKICIMAQSRTCTLSGRSALTAQAARERERERQTAERERESARARETHVGCINGGGPRVDQRLRIEVSKHCSRRIKVAVVDVRLSQIIARIPVAD
jgi:hypothetical protein